VRLVVTMLLIAWVSAALLLAWVSATRAQDLQSVPDGATFVAALAPLRGLRDEAWPAGPRQAAIQAVAANNHATLGYGDMQAL
jgi:hypothetical protein